jgi:predicted PurR-regulated permease PerM
MFGFTIPVVALNIWVLGQLFSYFEQLLNLVVTAAVLAFLLNYLVQGFERGGLGRNQARLLVLLVALATLVLLGLVLVPIVVNQATQLLQDLPKWLERSNNNLTWLENFIAARNLPFKLDQLSNQIADQVRLLLGLLPGLAIGTLGRFLDSLLILVLTCYMLFYGGRMWQGLINLLPAPLGPTLNQAIRLNFQRFFIAQLLLALFMFATTVPVLLFLQVNFALLFALLIGISQLVPVVGASLGIALVTLLVMLQDVWVAFYVAAAAVFLQQVKDNLLAPRMLGNMIGVNPLWQFVALLIGARIAGLLGVILSIPIAATIKATAETLRQRPPTRPETEVQE